MRIHVQNHVTAPSSKAIVIFVVARVIGKMSAQNSTKTPSPIQGLRDQGDENGKLTDHDILFQETPQKDPQKDPRKDPRCMNSLATFPGKLIVWQSKWNEHVSALALVLIQETEIGITSPISDETAGLVHNRDLVLTPETDPNQGIEILVIVHAQDPTQGTVVALIQGAAVKIVQKTGEVSRFHQGTYSCRHIKA
jgi:hypothetical protein